MVKKANKSLPVFIIARNRETSSASFYRMHIRTNRIRFYSHCESLTFTIACKNPGLRRGFD